ncbi:MAG TPA: hypothetical protein VGB17_18025 [Pyrinomonadaceae bacterium]|jgi:hypothetical protein
MSIRVMKILFALVFCLALGLVQAQAQSPESEALTNASVLKLARAGFKEKTIIAIIRTRPSHFDLAPDRLIELKRGGVSENIILAMLARQDDDALFSDNWSSDPFFSNPSGRARQKGNAPATDGESVDIFGSNSGSSASSRTSGARDGNQGDSNITGRATVRIMRPPVEQGGAPRLERTPTLSNQSIVELVEAGFSEGTILRRIEQSPADYDLSTQKISELRRRRVSDKIIAAMKAAMEDDAPPVPTPSSGTP